MNKITAKVASRSALAAALSLGLTVGAVGVASASSVGHHQNHGGREGKQLHNAVMGVVSAYSAGTSISITLPGATTATTYKLSSTTTVDGLASGATLVAGTPVVLLLSGTTAPVTVTAIRVPAPRPVRVEGVVSAYSAGTSISITPRGATTSVQYNLTSTTTIVGLTPTVGAQADLLLSGTTAPVTVTAIRVEAPRPVRVEGVVSAYTAGTSISITLPGATTATTYNLTSTTTVDGLAAAPRWSPAHRSSCSCRARRLPSP